MYNNIVDKVFFNWLSLKHDATTYEEIDYTLRGLIGTPIPKKLSSKIKPYKYVGNSFLLNPIQFLNVQVHSEFKLQALELASLRNYSDYTLYGHLGINIEISPFTKQILTMNPLLELKNDTIYIKTGKKWH